jgi:hypothetical protein
MRGAGTVRLALALLAAAGCAAACKDGRAPWEGASARSPDKGTRPGAMADAASGSGPGTGAAADTAIAADTAAGSATGTAVAEQLPAGPPGFDFRLARLDPSTRGTTQLCDVTEFEPTGPGRALLGCWGGVQAIAVELQGQVPTDSVRRGQRIRVRITGPGAESGGPESQVQFAGLAGDAPAGLRPAVPAGAPASGFDFSTVNRDAALHQTVQLCHIRSTDRIARVDPTASRGTPATWFTAAQASHWLRVTCSHGGSTSRLVIGARGYQALLPLRSDVVARVRVLHQGSYPQREAIGLLVDLAHQPPAASPFERPGR